MDAAAILLQAAIFRDLSASDIAELLPGLIERSFVRGEVVWLAGEPADVLVVLAEGQLKVHRINSDGREVIVDVVTAVATTGEVGLFHPAGSRWLSLSAMTATRCLMIRRAALLAFLSRHPAALQRMLELLASAAVLATNSLSSVAFDDIGHRVAGRLLEMADAQAEQTADGLRLTPRLSQTELAAQVAASRENVNRSLAALVVAGVISQRNGHFYVHDRAALAVAAGSDPDGL